MIRWNPSQGQRGTGTVQMLKTISIRYPLGYDRSTYVIAIEATNFTTGPCQVGRGFHGSCHSRVPLVKYSLLFSADAAQPLPTPDQGRVIPLA